MITFFLCLTLVVPFSSCQSHNNHFSKAKQLYEEAKYQEAAEELEKEIASNPSSLEAHYLLANSYYYLEMYEEAEKKYKQILEMDPSDEKRAKVYVGIGIIYRERKRYDEAIEQFKKAIIHDQNLTRAYLYIGQVYVLKEDIFEGINFFKKALQLDPNMPQVYYRLGHAYSLLGYRKEAIDTYERVLKIGDGHKGIHYILGDLYFREGRYDDAIREFKKELERDPNFVEAIYNLGRSYHKKGNFNEAMAQFKTAIKLEPRNLHIRYAMADLYLESDNIGEAKELLEELILKNPTYPYAHSLIGWIYDNKLGRPNEALKHYSKFLEILRNSDDEIKTKRNSESFEKVKWVKNRIEEIKSTSSTHPEGEPFNEENSYENWRISLDNTTGDSSKATSQMFVHNKYGVEVTFVPEDKDMGFALYWLGYIKEAEPLPEKEREGALKILDQEMVKYPPRILRGNVKRIYVMKNMKRSKGYIGGTFDFRQLFLVKGDDDKFLAEAFHHEFAHLLFNKYKRKFELYEWEQINPEEFEYYKDAWSSTSENHPRRYLDPYHLKGGFISDYAATSLEEDIAEMAVALFTPEEDFWKAADSHERIRKKLDLLINFYRSLDPMFTEEYFRGLAKESQN